VGALRRKFPQLKMLGAYDKMVMPLGREAMRGEFERLLPVMASGGYLVGCDHQTPPGCRWRITGCIWNCFGSMRSGRWRGGREDTLPRFHGEPGPIERRGGRADRVAFGEPHPLALPRRTAGEGKIY